MFPDFGKTFLGIDTVLWMMKVAREAEQNSRRKFKTKQYFGKGGQKKGRRRSNDK